MKHALYILMLSTLFISCKKQVYHSFTDEERAYLVYDKGDTFKLKDENTGDTLEFTVTDKYVHFAEDFGTTIGPSRKEHFMEEGSLEFSDKSGSNTGYIYIYKDKIDQFSLGINFTFRPNYSFGVSGESGPTSIEDITVNGIKYKNVHNFYSDTYLSLEFGFVQLINTNSGGHYTRVP